METPKISRRGVYYDLNLSPYRFISPYGDIFKFSSRKRLEMFKNQIPKDIERGEKFFTRNGLKEYIPKEILSLVYRNIYKSTYCKIEVHYEQEK